MLNYIARVITPVRFFLSTALIFGTIILIVFPPMTAPDERGHFAKAYAFSEGQIIPEYENIVKNPYTSWDKYGFDLPDDINDLNEDAIGVIYNPEQEYAYDGLQHEKYGIGEREFTGLGGQLNYSFFQYIPQIVGIKLSSLFTPSILVAYYAAKVTNFLAYILLIVFSLRLFQFSKWALVLLALNPMFLTLATSTSGDGFTNALSFYFVSLLSVFIVSEKPIRKWSLLTSFVTLIALVQMKPPLIVLGFLYILIPLERLSLKEKLFYGPLVFIISVGIYYFWGKLFPTQQVMYQDFTDSSRQIDFILHRPIDFIRVIKNTVLTKTGFLLKSYSGQFSALNRNLPTGVIGFYYVMVLLVSFGSEKSMSFLKKLGVLFSLGLFVLLTFIALYQIWTPVGSMEIIGLQGRYFIPISLLAVLLLNHQWFKLSNTVTMLLSITTMVIVLTATTLFLVNSYGFLDYIF